MNRRERLIIFFFLGHSDYVKFFIFVLAAPHVDTMELILMKLTHKWNQYLYELVLIIVLATAGTSKAQTTPGNSLPVYYGTYQQYSFSIVLKNDSSFSAKGHINAEDKKAQFLVYRSHGTTKSLFPSNTKSLTLVGTDGTVIPGIPVDSCWLFMTSKGRINQYSFRAKPETRDVVAIQKGSTGAIVLLTKENLLDLVGHDNASVIKLIENEKFLKAIAVFNEQ